MPATFAKDGAIAELGPNDTGALCSGIGVSPANSGAPAIQSVTAADFKDMAIGSGTTASSASNLGQTVDMPLTIVGGTGYTNGVFLIDSAGGGKLAGEAQIEVTVAGGIIQAAARLVRAGSGFTSAPTFTPTAAMGGGTGGTITATVSIGGRVQALGAAYGANKGTRYLTAAGSVANNAAISGGYLNRSGRAMVTGESAWGVAP